MDDATHMRRFWDARAREDARYFVDNRLAYRAPGDDGFWTQGEQDLDRMLAALDLRVAPTDVVLDVGCGVGRLLKPLARRARHVHGVDVSAEMATRARAEVPEATVHLGDGRTLPLPDASVDAVVSLVVFQHLPDPALTYGYVREIGRVLRPGGWTAFQVSDDPEVHSRDYPAPGRLARALRRAPRGQDDPAWRGSAVDLGRLRAAAADGGLTVERTTGEGTQYCLVRASRDAGTRAP